MRRHGILVASLVLSAAAGTAFAGMGTSQFGLPYNWTTSTGRGYGSNVINGNGASAMCVECHTVNPSAFIRDVKDQGAATIARTDNLYKGSHFVINAGVNGTGAVVNMTNSGGGFGGGFTAARDNGEYLKGSAWASGATSKVGTGAGFVSGLDGVVANGSADLICESCHNVVTNASSPAAGAIPVDNDLLVGQYVDNVVDSICTGCHAKDETAAGRQLFHTNDNLAPFAGPGAATGRKRHHVMDGDNLADNFYRTGADSTMWAPSASNRLDAGWCGTGAYSKAVNPSINFNTAGAGVAIAYRAACNAAGQGTRDIATPITLGDCTPSLSSGAPGNNILNCSSCHRPHNAMANSGAFILRYGDIARTVVFTNDAGVANIGGMTGLTAASPIFGIRRQSDVDTTYVTKVYTDYRALCSGCHVGY